MVFENLRKTTSDIVPVVASVRIRRWTALKQVGIQQLVPDCSIIIIIIIIIAAADISEPFLLRIVLPFPPSWFVSSRFSSL
jgi:hypothetical protein